ncbi:MAG TPA: hypothetical protein VNS34_21605 [Rhizobiaceae bacterium]|nr:hypothetical protein [Rhizobiaceae bacterium]
MSFTTRSAGAFGADFFKEDLHHNLKSVPLVLTADTSTFRKLSGKRMYIRTASRITSGEELNLRNGLNGNTLDLRLIPRS